MFNLDSNDKEFFQSVRRETQESLRQIRCFYNCCSEIAGITKKDDNSMSSIVEVKEFLSQMDSLQSQLNRLKKTVSRTRKFTVDFLSPSQREEYEIR